jgi:ABC-type branched-subunit amino acid transport system ATPase component
LTTQLKAADIKVDNNLVRRYGDVTGLTAGQVVSVYLTQTSTSAVASEPAAGSTLTITIPDGQLRPGGGKLYVTVKNANELESKRTAQSYLSEITAAPKVGNILVINNPGRE